MDALERAKAGLQFDDIFQTSASASLHSGFEVKFAVFDEASCHLQFKHVVQQSNVLDFQSDTETLTLFRVYIDVGVRLIGGLTEKDVEEPTLQIEASYCVDYRINASELKGDNEALDQFALQNASYHLWPFWREFVMSQCTRMNVPKIPMPMRLQSPRQ